MNIFQKFFFTLIASGTGPGCVEEHSKKINREKLIKNFSITKCCHIHHHPACYKSSDEPNSGFVILASTPTSDE